MKANALILAGVVILIGLGSCKQGGSGANVKSLSTQTDTVSYAIGQSIGSNLLRDGMEELNVDLIAQAVKDALTKATPLVKYEDCVPTIQEYYAAKQKIKSASALEDQKKFFDENGKKTGVITTASGMQYEVIKEGTGAKPTAADNVTTHYHGTLLDGTIFDSSVDRGEPVSFPVTGVIPGWTEALQLMSVGSKWKLYLPSNLAYGEQGAGPSIGPNTPLIFEVELLGINDQPKEGN